MDRESTTVTQEQGQVAGQSGADDFDSEAEEQYFIRLDSRRLSEEFSRLEKENKEFGNLLHARIGSRAAERYQPRIRQYELELQELRKERRWAELERMDSKEVEERYATDEAFAREWTEFVHRSPERAAAERETAMVTERIERIFNRAGASGVPTEVVEEYRKALIAGKYDVDEDGQPISHWSDGLERLRDDLTSELSKPRQTRQPDGDEEEDDDEEEEPPSRQTPPSGPASRRRSSTPTSPNPALVSGGPDSTPSSRGGIARTPRYRTQVEAAKLFNEGKLSAEKYREAQRTLPYE